MLRDAGFGRFNEHHVIETHVWTADSIVGFLRATSAGSRAAMGEHADAFEDAVRSVLLEVDGEGRYRQEIDYAVRVARR